MNVIGSRPDGWWRDRPAAARRLLERLQQFVEQDGIPVTLVLEGDAARGIVAGSHRGVEVTCARRAGRDAGDDRIVDVVTQAPDPSRVSVVTSDRALANRVEPLGATVVGAAALLTRLDEVALSHRSA